MGAGWLAGGGDGLLGAGWLGGGGDGLLGELIGDRSGDHSSSESEGGSSEKSRETLLHVYECSNAIQICLIES